MTVTTSTGSRLHAAPRSSVFQDQGSFRIRFNFPGRAVAGHGDHGYGPLATVVESFMDPDTVIPMHPHRNEEIVSWVPAGVMRHDDWEGTHLVTDPEHLMVMNAGREFRHAERTAPEDPPLRMLQIFVRPHSLDLPAGIQHEPLPEPVAGEWRTCFGPEAGDAPCFVRNDVRLFDCRLGTGTTVSLPTVDDWHAYVYVFEGAVDCVATDRAERAHLGETESAVLTEPGAFELTATADSLVVAFLLDPDAPVTRRGTIGR